MSESTNKPTFQPLPAGDYLVRMSRFEEKPTKNGAGVLISAGFEVVSGESKGRLVFHNFLVEHTNPKAQEIGNKQLDEYLQAVKAGGLEGINHDRTLLEQWTEIPFTAVLSIDEPQSYRAADGSMQKSKARNKIKKFMAR
jgi:hypothetical protein